VFQFRENDLRNALQPAKKLIDGLKKINCRIAINNYTDAAEGLLKHVDLDIVKLSPEYMRDLATDTAQQNRMSTVNAQLQEDGYKTIASSVEDAGSLAILWNIGINYIQGYFLQQPSNSIAFEDEQPG
jgi:EAL domain-containing protein (putative c-di-GMP-specific phosphodiesterase class I)